MWWNTLHDPTWPVCAFFATLNVLQIQTYLYEFLFLGIVPGTSLRINYDSVLVIAILIASWVLIHRISKTEVSQETRFARLIKRNS